LTVPTSFKLKFGSPGGLAGTISLFFDKPAVMRAIPPAERRVLSKMGAYTMRRDRQSIKERPGPAPPGQPPHAHTTYQGKPGKSRKQTRKRRLKFKDSILFAADMQTKTVVIGPVLFDSLRRPTVPELLEKGGRSPLNKGSYEPRPHTGPAFQRELRDGLPKILRDCVTKR
jgi:hypothetical protein